jgi:TorA maturation chaperone TorD
MELPELLEDTIDCYVELSLNRSNFYFYLSSIFLKPPTMDTINIFNELIGSAEYLNFLSTQTKDFLSTVEDLNNRRLENLVQEYHDLFTVPLSKYVIPYESVYREGCLRGQSSVYIKTIYNKLGFQIPRNYYELPDHIGIELAFMATLCKEEHKACGTKNGKRARSLRKIESRFLNEHITRWLPELCNKICEKTKSSFYLGMSKITLDFVLADTRTLIQVV